MNSGEPGDGAAPPHGRRSILRSGYWLALLFIVVSYVLSAAQTTPDPNAIALLFQLVSVGVILWITEVNSSLLRVVWGVVLAAGAVIIAIAATGATGRSLDIFLSGASLGAYLAAAIGIFAHEAKKKRVDGQTLLAAIAAYLLLGMFFTFLYNLIGLVSGEPTFSDGEPDSLTGQLFFSFTTLTTTGYGDKVPASALVQGFAIAEAVTGQLFLVIALARVVSEWRPPARG